MLLWLATFLALTAFTIVGGVLTWMWCSRRAWCPYYLRRKLDRWYSQAEKANKDPIKKREKILPFDDPREPGGKAA
jgi:hypothetical protein